MRDRETKKRSAAAVILFSAAFLFAGCTSNPGGQAQGDSKMTEAPEAAENSEAAEKQTQTAVENSEAADKKTDIYDSVLAEYRDMVQNDFYMELLDSDTYDSSFGAHIGLEIRHHRQNVYYALYDIDGNGTDELIIAGGEKAVSDPDFSPWNYDLYGYDGNNVVHIFPDMEFGYRTNFSLCENGIIKVFYSSSAAESGFDFYRLADDGVSAALVESFACVGRLEGETSVFTYYRNKEEVTEQEYNAGILSYDTALTTPPDWRQLP